MQNKDPAVKIENRRLRIEERQGRCSIANPPSPRLHSAFCVHHSAYIRAYTLVELFLTLAVLMIILGLMMNLANRVRRELAEKLTRQVLTQLTRQMNEYKKTYNTLPPVMEISPPPEPISDETQLQLQARQNNADFVRYLNLTALAKSGKTANDPLAECLGRSTAGLLEDPWGSPIVFMPTQNSRIGMAPHEFFFSAGPDGKFLTREDNVYSYEGEK